jgi:hypothetical protein
MTRLPLSDTLVELLEGVTPGDGMVRVQRVAFDLPLEVALSGTAEEPELRANLPRWRWPTDFDSRPGRLAATFDLGSPL